MIVGGATTISDAVLLVAPGPLSFEFTGPVVLFCVPGAMPVTFNENMQDPFAASVPPEKLMVVLPALAVIDPVQVVLNPLGVDTISPAGRVSPNEIPVNGNAFGFARVKLALVIPLSGIVAAPNAFVTIGGGGCTTILAPEEGQFRPTVQGSLSAKTQAVFVYVPALEFGGPKVELCTWTVAWAPGARFPN